MAKYILSVDIDVESTESLDEVTSRIETLLSELIEDHNADAIEQENDFLVYDFDIIEAYEDTADVEENEEEDDNMPIL